MPPGVEFVFEIRASIAETLIVGKSKYGERRVVPITGGTVGGERLSGEVLPGGADIQLVRADGDIELDASYLLRASDGALIYVCNRALVHIPKGIKDRREVYVRTVPSFEAASDGPHAWLNHGVFVGGFQLAAKDQVVIRVHRVS
jgi:hypothetical protein